VRLAHKIGLMPAVAALAFGALFMGNEVSRGRNARLMSRIQTEYVPALETSRDVQARVMALQRALQDAASAADLGQLEVADQAKVELVDRLREGAALPGLREECRAVEAELERYYALARALTLRLIREQHRTSLDAGQVDELQRGYRALVARTEASAERHRTELRATFDEAAADQRWAATAMSAVIVLALLILGIVSTRVIRSTTLGLRQAVAVADGLSRGDLARVPDPGSDDEVGQLLASMHRMMGYLRETAALAERIGGIERESPAGERSLGNAFGKIAEAESRHRHLLGSIPAILWRADTAQRLLFVSPGAEKILGHPAQRWTDDPSFWRAHVHPHDLDRAVAAGQRAADTGKDEEIEYRMIRADGQTVWLHGSIQRVIGDGGAPELVGVLMDVTEQNRAKDKLERSERQLSEGQALAHVGSWEWDMVSHGLTWSDELCRIYGQAIAPARVEGVVRLVHPADRDRFRAGVEGLGGAIGPFIQDMRIVRPDGSVRVLRSAGNVIADETGRAVRVVGASQDITEAQAAVVAQKESEERYRVLFEHNPQAMWVYDPRTLRFLAVNDAALRQYGYERPEIMEMSVLALQPSEDTEAFRAEAAAGCGPGTTTTGRHRRHDGSLLDVEVTSRGIAYGEWQACLVLANDITERRRLEAQLRQSQKLEAIGQLAGGVAHDFNNILGVIMGYGQLLKQRLPAGDPLLKNAAEILAASDRGAALTRQLLAFSRKQVLQPRVLDLNLVVGDMDVMLRRLIGEQVRLLTSPQKDLGHVRADPGQMEQVLMNLAVNARDAMPLGGTLTVETGNVDLDVAYALAHHDAQPGPHVMLAVSDTGHGIEPSALSHIFEPFFTTKEQGKGTGLGLATIYGIVKQSGGHVTVYSEIGHGTTFKVFLPRISEALPARAAAETAESPAGTETVLLAEDEAGLRLLLHEVLEAAGYHVLTGATPEEAFARAEAYAGPIHLLITDVVMPGESGRRLAERLEAVRPDIQTIYMSGYTHDAIGHHGLLETGTHFLQKPFTVEALLQKIREALGLVRVTIAN
jgi:PAS domain S-box-containing protein